MFTLNQKKMHLNLLDGWFFASLLKGLMSFNHDKNITVMPNEGLLQVPIETKRTYYLSIDTKIMRIGCLKTKIQEAICPFFCTQESKSSSRRLSFSVFSIFSEDTCLQQNLMLLYYIFLVLVYIAYSVILLLIL